MAMDVILLSLPWYLLQKSPRHPSELSTWARLALRRTWTHLLRSFPGWASAFVHCLCHCRSVLSPLGASQTIKAATPTSLTWAATRSPSTRIFSRNRRDVRSVPLLPPSLKTSLKSSMPFFASNDVVTYLTLYAAVFSFILKISSIRFENPAQFRGILAW